VVEERIAADLSEVKEAMAAVGLSPVKLWRAKDDGRRRGYAGWWGLAGVGGGGCEVGIEEMFSPLGLDWSQVGGYFR